MRVNFFGQSGTSNAGSSQGLNAIMTGPLILAGNPTGPLEATPKQYVDNVVNSLNAANIKTGTINVARLPAFTGDVSSATGSGTFLLTNTGVSPGSYTKVTVDAKGRVLGGANITINDIPPFNWSKIVAGSRPTTISGYNINDALSKTGSTVTGTLSLNVDPTSALHAANKQYVDQLGGGGALFNTGIITRRPVSTTPVGFLRCNGGQLSRTTYSALFAAVKAPYVTTNTLDYTSYVAMGAGQPCRQQYDSNASQSADITGWQSGPGMPMDLYGAQPVVTKNRVYLLGGVLSGTYTNKVHTAVINADGSVGTWSEAVSNALPGALGHSQVIVTKNRVYLLGGHKGSPATEIFTAPINADGTLGTWAYNADLPASFGHAQAFMTSNRVYLLAGSSDHAASNVKTTIYSATVASNGTIGAFTVAGNLLTARYQTQLVVTKNRVYVIGGTDINNTSLALVESAPINSDGTLGAWVTNTSLPTPASQACSFVTKNRVYIFGGRDVNTNVYTAPINTDGTLGTWTAGTPLALGVYWTPHIFATNTRLYIVNGYAFNATATRYAPLTGAVNDYTSYYDGTINKFDGSNVTGTVVLADSYDSSLTTNQPGAGQPWCQQYDINKVQADDITGWASAGSLLGNIRCAQSVITKDRVYILALRDQTTPVATVYTAPINSDGTLGVWTTGTSLPAALSDSQAIVTKNRIYLLGGVNSATVSVTTVYTAPINSDGTIGAWTTGTSLPAGLSRSQAVVTKNRVYLLGGNNDAGKLNTVYTAAINTDGTLGVWAADLAMPVQVRGHSVAVVKNVVYLLGGLVGTTYGNGVYRAPINPDGTLGSWTQGTSMPYGIMDSSVILTKSKIYTLGFLGDLGWGNVAYSANITGGLNDYSSYYDGTITGLDLTSFLLPDFSALETASEFYFIKT